jgi:uncharacterized protein YndB with AHSA1/START domain
MSSNTSEPVHVVCRFSALPEAAFDAWLQPEVVRRWLFASP